MAHTPTKDQIDFARYLSATYFDDRLDEEMTFDEYLDAQLDCLDAPYEEIMLTGFDNRDEAKASMIKLSLEIFNG